MPTLPSQVNGVVYDTEYVKLENATVVLTHSSETLTVMTNSDGEYIFNLGDLDSWDENDSATITASKTKKGTKTETITLVSGGVTQDIYLAETSNLSFPEQTQDRYNLNFSLLTDYAGNKITVDNPLPVKSIGSGDVDLSNNPSWEWSITRQDGQPDYEEVTIRGVTYRRTFTYTGNYLTGRSSWVKQ